MDEGGFLPMEATAESESMTVENGESLFGVVGISPNNSPEIELEEENDDFDGTGPDGTMGGFRPYNITYEERDGPSEYQIFGAGNRFASDLAINRSVIDKFRLSEGISERQKAVRNIALTMGEVLNDAEMLENCFHLVESSFLTDDEPCVRRELVEQLPMIALLCSQVDKLNSYLPDRVVPVIIKIIADNHPQVRKACIEVITVIMDRRLLTLEMIETVLLPKIFLMIESGCADDMGAEAIELLVALAQRMPQEKVLAKVLPRYIDYCSYPSICIRKACASYMGTFSKLLPRVFVEKYLLIRMITLGQDSIWGVRKSCAESMPAFSSCCCMRARWQHLTPAYLALLSDTNHWVRVTAYQYLGQFIATFANMANNGYSFTNGEILYDQDAVKTTIDEDEVQHMANCPALSNLVMNHPEDDALQISSVFDDHIPVTECDRMAVLSDAAAAVQSPNSTDSGQPEIAALPPSELVAVDHSVQLSNKTKNKVMEEAEIMRQDIVPHALLNCFLSMPTREAEFSTENEIACQCSYGLPAVALTLGRNNWKILIETFNLLVTNSWWKVRRGVAFSLHMLAAIVGPEATVKDILPTFIAFIRDLDEVRLGILEHMDKFLKLLDRDSSRQILSHLANFLQNDSASNWRFRILFVEQLISICKLYDVQDLNEYFSPIAMTLAIDRVAEVRSFTSQLIAKLVKSLYYGELSADAAQTTLTDSFAQDIVKSFAKSVKYARRQTYARICCELLNQQSVDGDDFRRLFLPAFVELFNDAIVNVRITSMTMLKEHAAVLQQLMTDQTFNETVSHLADDKDGGVRELAMSLMQFVDGQESS